MTYSSKTPCPDRVLPSTTVWFFQRETKQSLHTPHFSLHSSHSELETSHSKLHTSHFALHTSHFSLPTASFTLQTSHFTLRASHSKPRQPFDFFSERRSKVFTLHTSHCTLRTPNLKLHTPHFTLHTSHFTLPTTHETVSQPSHRRGRSSRFGDGLCMEKHRVSIISYLSKTHFVRDFLQNSIGNSSTSTTCNPIYSEGTILELQITMELHRQLIHQHHLQPHLQCGNDPTVANHNGILSTTHARKAVETPFTMRNRSENDPRIIRTYPTTHETVSQPSHRRGRSSRFGDGLCMEKHRVSCICYLSKTHFVRDFLQNSIGNSSTSTACNPIYSKGTILDLQITMEFHRQLIHQHHLQSHLHCGNDPTVANHNGILSTTHARKAVETPFTMRNRSENDPNISDHTRDRLATVAPQR